jgi:SAM-dependent methyltransferase
MTVGGEDLQRGAWTIEKFKWRVQSAEDLEQSRASRFRPEWRTILLGYFGLRPGMQVLGVGCGPGTLAPYLAEGIAPGLVTGLDLDEEFIARAQQKAARAGSQHVRYVAGDAYALPFATGSFDAAVSYTGIGVLADPPRAVAEMVRVCRPGGSVSIAESVGGPNGIRFAGVDSLGSEEYPGARRFHELYALLVAGHGRPAPGVGSRRWPAKALMGLLAGAGLESIELNAWGHVEAADDVRVLDEARRAQRLREFESLREWLSWLRDVGDFSHLGPAEIDELTVLGKRRLDWSLERPLWDWEASLSVVAHGFRSGGN